MVAAALDRPGLRLTREELLAQYSAPLSKPHTPTSCRPGGVPGKPPGTGMDLREIRHFVEGDDLRLIAPSVTARTGQLHVRSFHEDRDDATLLIADFRRTMLWGTSTALRSVRAGRLLADLGWQAIQRGGSVGLLIVNDISPVVLPLATGELQMMDVASSMAKQHDEALSNHPPRPGGMIESLGRALAMAPPGIENNPAARDAVDSHTLREVASAGGGESYRVRNMEDLRAMAESLDRLEPNPRLRPPLQLWQPLWHWPATLALIILLLITVRQRT